MWTFREEKNILPLPGIELNPDCSLVTLPITVARLMKQVRESTISDKSWHFVIF